MRIKGSIAVVTGASEGIGRAITLALAKRGATVWAIARHNEPLAALAAEHKNIKPLVADLTVLAQRTMVAETVGDIDILINNAGIGFYRMIDTITEAEYRKMFELNVFAPLDLTQQLLPVMSQRKRAQIVNVGSLAGYVSFANLTYYAMTKFAINALSMGLRHELRHTNVGVSLITPGPVNTGFRTKANRRETDETAEQSGQGVSANAVARAVVRAIRLRKIPGYQTIAVPRVGGFLRAASLPLINRVVNFGSSSYSQG